MHLRRGCAMLAAAVVAVLLSAGLPSGSGSGLGLRNGTLVVSNATCTPGPSQLGAVAAVLFAGALNNTGLAERSEYAQAYLCPDGVSLCGPLNVLESYATVEANNSFIQLNATGGDINALDLILRENNTFLINAVPSVAFNYSTVSLGAHNWFYITNGSSLSLNVSRLNFTNHFAWVVDASNVSAVNSLLDFGDTVQYFTDSTLTLSNITWNGYSSGNVAPPLYEGKLEPVAWFDNSTIGLSGTQATFTNLSRVLVTDSALLLANSTLTLVNTTLELWGSTLGLANSRIEVTKGSTIAFYCGSSVIGDGLVSGASLTAPLIAPGLNVSRGADALRGTQLGGADVAIVQEARGEISLSPISV